MILLIKILIPYLKLHYRGKGECCSTLCRIAIILYIHILYRHINNIFIFKNNIYHIYNSISLSPEHKPRF
jgi:hypothetical protein